MLQPINAKPRLRPCFVFMLHALRAVMVVAVLVSHGMLMMHRDQYEAPAPVVNVPAAEDLHLGYHGYNTGTTQFQDLSINANPCPCGGLQMTNGGGWMCYAVACGTGTANTLARFTGSTTLGNSTLNLNANTLGEVWRTDSVLSDGVLIFTGK